MKADQYAVSISSPYLDLVNIKKTQNSSTHFPLNLTLPMYHKPLSWYEQENLSHRTTVLEVCTRVHKIPNSAIFGFTYQQRMQT
jgi:hypothetical protein